MTLALTAAGILQVYMERIAGLPFMQVQDYLSLFYAIRFWSGAAMVAGVVLFLLDVFALTPKKPLAPGAQGARTQTST